MTDTQDTNLPKMEEGLEDVKQSVEVPAEAEASVAAQESAVEEAVAEVKATAEEAVAEEVVAEEAAVEEAVAAEAQEAMETAALNESVHKLTKAEILDRLRVIAEDVTKSSKAEIDSLKQNFYRLHNSEVEAATLYSAAWSKSAFW